jgi:hypothetical protein
MAACRKAHKYSRKKRKACEVAAREKYGAGKGTRR